MLTMPLLILSTEFRIVYSVEKHCIMRSVCLLCSDYAPIMLVYARLCSDYAPIMLMTYLSHLFEIVKYV